jgi:hypothetical protein
MFWIFKIYTKIKNVALFWRIFYIILVFFKEKNDYLQQINI